MFGVYVCSDLIEPIALPVLLTTSTEKDVIQLWWIQFEFVCTVYRVWEKFMQSSLLSYSVPLSEWQFGGYKKRDKNLVPFTICVHL